MNIRLTTTLLLFCLGLFFQKGSAQSTQCKENEEYSECGSGCPLTCKNHRESLFCTEHCKKGCFCKPGYVLGPDNKCILPDHCPIGPCRNTEVASTCVNPCNNCLQRGRCYYEFCNKGCDCRPGYYRNSTGICVIESKCESPESACPKNEHYVNCVSQCNDCWSRGDCEEEEEYCNAGCDCKPGYFRDDYGTCVPEQQCMSQGTNCGVNEVYSDCAVPCNDCEKRGNCRYTCEFGCDCKKGYHRNNKGVCVHSSECFTTTTACGLYEEYSECGSACPHTCSNLGKSIVCTQQCVKGCFCVNGYVRGPDGKCVTPNDCPGACSENEEYQRCGSPCPKTCANYEKPIICAEYCVKGCFCKPGFIRNSEGKCILPNYCPKVCGKYEEYSECGSFCPIHCTNITTSSRIPCPNMCAKGCFCAAGYVRGPGGDCILPSYCPTVCGVYEEFKECGSQCEASCTNRTINASICLLPCKRGCFCSAGYVRGPDGICILPASCPTVCGEYEEFRECGPSCLTTCENHLNLKACPPPCVRGCFCKPGYVKGPSGKCILPEYCPGMCSENEIYMRCGPRCEPSCSFLHRSAALCPSCKKGCFCKPGYVRGPTDNCILPTSCPPVCGENEEYSECGSACPASCFNRSPNCTNRCVKGCFCKAGYIKDVDGNCILPADCPAPCREYEEFRECGPACPDTCFNRSQVCIQSCVRGCFCAPGYVKSPQGDCILPSKCPVVCGENEEFTECGSACPHTCADRNSVCPPACVRGCFCRDGYIKDSFGKCILPIDCPIDCPENEQFRLCGSSCPINCTNIGRSVSCRLECVRGCFCNDGFVRGPDGKCIKPDSCPRRDTRRCTRRRCPGRFGGRNKGDDTEEEEAKTTLSSTDETKIPLTTGSSLDSTTNLSEKTTSPDLTSLSEDDPKTTTGNKITVKSEQSTIPETVVNETPSNSGGKTTQLIETSPSSEIAADPTMPTTVKPKDPPTPITLMPTTIKLKDPLTTIALIPTTIKDISPAIAEDAVVDGKTTPAESAKSTIVTTTDNPTVENVITTTTSATKVLL